MTSLQAAKVAYEKVNLAGRLDDRWLNTPQLCTDGLLKMTQLRHRQSRRPAAPQPTLTRVKHAVEDAMVHASAQVSFCKGISLSLQRAVPFFWASPRLAPTMLGSLYMVSKAYPLAELAIGRGHDVIAQDGNFYSSAIARAATQFYSQASHHGLAGVALEVMPVAAAKRLEASGHTMLATACMCAAVCGRLLLQAPRLVLGLTVNVMETAAGIGIYGQLLALEVGLRGMRAGVQGFAWTTGVDCTRVTTELGSFIGKVRGIAAINVGAVGHLAEADRTALRANEPNAAGRVQHHATRLIARFAEVQVNAADESAQVRRIAEEIAEELRAYCHNLPSPYALRYGLRLVADYIDVSWEGDEVGFHPPELADDAAAAA